MPGGVKLPRFDPTGPNSHLSRLCRYQAHAPRQIGQDQSARRHRLHIRKGLPIIRDSWDDPDNSVAERLNARRVGTDVLRRHRRTSGAERQYMVQAAPLGMFRRPKPPTRKVPRYAFSNPFRTLGKAATARPTSSLLGTPERSHSLRRGGSGATGRGEDGS
jgi:hypothetical protein